MGSTDTAKYNYNHGACNAEALSKTQISWYIDDTGSGANQTWIATKAGTDPTYLISNALHGKWIMIGVSTSDGTGLAPIHYSSWMGPIADNAKPTASNVVAAFVGAAAVTHYRIGGALAQSFFDLMLAIGGVFPSVFSRLEGARDFEGIKRTFFFATKITICVSSFIGFGLIAWGKPFIARWMGPSYLDGYPVLVALVLGCVFTSSQGPSVGLLYGTSRHKFLALVNSIEGVTNLALSIILVRMMGIVGVALGTLIPMTASKLIVQPFYVCRVSHIPYVEYLRRCGRTVAVVLLSLAIPFLLAEMLAAPDYKILVVLAVLSFTFYAASLWLFEFNSREKEVLKKAFRLSPATKDVSAAPSLR